MKKFLIIPGVVFLLLFSFFFVGKAPQKEVKWGVNYSSKHARQLGLDHRETYLAILNDLKPERIKMATHWDELEPEENEFHFTELDWMIKKAKEENTKILLVVGMKTPRWPECHVPLWAQGLSTEKREEKVRRLIKKVVSRYSEEEAIWAFQIENEPFLNFGICPQRGKDFLKKEVALARSLTDKTIVVSDSGEWSFWTRAAKAGDIVATTIYRRVWFDKTERYATYPLPPVFYWRKSLIVRTLFNKEVFCGELQAEPWGPVLLYDLPRSEQQKTMNLELFENVLNYARKTGLKEHYLWGTEWWYWLKIKENDPSFWNKVQVLLENSREVE